jgi:hypothetical protein
MTDTGVWYTAMFHGQRPPVFRTPDTFWLPSRAYALRLSVFFKLFSPDRLGSGLSPVLTNRDENLLSRESGQNPVMRAVSLCVNVPDENGSIASKCSSPPLNRKRPQRLQIPLQLPGLNALFSAVEQAMEFNVEGFHYAVSSKKGRREYQVFSDFSYNSRILGWLTSLVSEPQLTADSYQIFSYSSDYLLMFTNLFNF